MKKIVRRSLYLIFLFTALCLAFQAVEYWGYVKAEKQQAIATGQQTTQALKAKIEALLQTIKTAGDDLGKKFGERDFTDKDVRKLIRQVALDYPEIRGVTACYQKNAFSKKRKLYCPYYNKGTQSYLYVEDSYDYTVKGKGTTWYTDVVEKGANWTDPYYGKAAKEWYVDYGVPFYFSSGPKKGQIRGIIDFSLEVGDFKRLVHSLTVGKTGYGLITSKNGKFITHPVNDNVGTKTVQDLLKNETRPGLRKAYEGLTKGKAGSSEFLEAETDETSVFFYNKIDISNFGLGMVFFKRDLLGPQRQLNRRYINICLTLSLLLILALTLYFGSDTLDRMEIEIISLLVSLFLIANVILVSYLQHTTVSTYQVESGPPIVDMTSLGNFVGQQNNRAEMLKIASPIPVPTGLYIERIEFEDSYNISVGGVVWQKYPLDLAKDVKIGFRFPQMAPFAEASFIEESYRETITGKEGKDGYLLVGWDYRVTLRLNLKYTNYPFDKRHLDIKILPLSPKDNLLFVPDLVSYDFSSPTKLIGLNPKISLSGNKITQSYFNFSTEHYDSNFGYNSKSYFETVPVLHYNVHIKRLLLNAFVTYLIPIAVTLILIYILILVCAKTEARQGIIESMAAFFFVLIFSHIDLRKNIVTADLMFMEYFYFITYLMIILSTLNLMTYTKSKTTLFDLNENQIFRAAYFPVFLVLLLIVMLTKFY